MSWIRRVAERDTVQYICPHCSDYHELRDDFGEYTFNENFIFCRRCGAKNGTGTPPTLPQPSNEPLTQADLNKMCLDEVWIEYPDGSGEPALVAEGKIYSVAVLEGAGLDLEEYIKGETLDVPTGAYKVYRRPPEGKIDA